ncbi:hypothetical protein FRACYDRAFT_233577 [Fragilariopsis cylindrus CCMP1102]|uniref:Phospholipid/glycerol acyltransferase domain-containing protein n=1 Tax=Fragilariopsis cylindrus CCMP1102 TaxID=635003 RepID=A0A1E7FZ62_9STRA|nr:hypothetical protein FRACYDRAFT_233577 [Fragilariopsis cylindrus CCMP1102]|eukprot:OEU23404.1 hypothetical protein FRACYDRAFT_233577 [Fragilariopsis cylindrus CCMP1102]
MIPCLPVFVTKESVFQMPIIGTITKDVLGSIGVSRSSVNITNPTNTNNNLTEQIIERVKSNNSTGTRTSRGCGPIVIFPEGTTTNGTCLIDFKTGAFVPLLNVLPICYSFVDSKKKNCDDSSNENSKSKSKSLPSFIPTYESIWTPVYIVRLLCQPYNRLKCEILPIQSPPATPTSTSPSTSTSTPKPTQSSSSSSTSTPTPLSTSTLFSAPTPTPTPTPLSTSTSLSSPQSMTTQTQQKLQLQHVLYANLVRQQMADTLQVPLVNNINYSPHKVTYHTLLRHQYKNTNKYYHPIYAMFFQPMQKVLPLLPTSRIEEEEEEEEEEKKKGAVLVEVEDNNRCGEKL